MSLNITDPGVPAGPPSGISSLLAVENLCVTFRSTSGPVYAVRDVSYSVETGRALGIAGESGSGKSAGLLALLGLLPGGAAVSGRAYFEGVDLIAQAPDQLRRLRGSKIGVVFQDPLSALNPVLTIGRQVVESLTVHQGIRGQAAAARAAELLDLVGIPNPRRRLRQYPHEFSGGMRQRVMIAAAIASGPRLLIADEPTTALDVTVQAQILDLIARLRRELHMAVVLVTHDLGVIAGVTDRAAVMYAGRVVESGPTEDVLRQPMHPYTHGLLRSVPRLDVPRGQPLEPIPGSPPDMRSRIPGCDFNPRCAWADEPCVQERPPLSMHEEDRLSACWFAEVVAADDRPELHPGEVSR